MHTESHNLMVERRIYLTNGEVLVGETQLENGGVWHVDGKGSWRWYPGHRIDLIVRMAS